MSYHCSAAGAVNGRCPCNTGKMATTTGLSHSDGKRPDRVTLVPWKSGRLLVWNATCPDTFAPSHLPSATREAGAVAAQAERSKQEKYAALN